MIQALKAAETPASFPGAVAVTAKQASQQKEVKWCGAMQRGHLTRRDLSRRVREADACWKRLLMPWRMVLERAAKRTKTLQQQTT
jgi:hypothetical protein